MRRILHLVLAGLVMLLPIETHAASSGSSSSHKKKKKPKKVKAKPAEQEEEAEAARSQGDDDESQGSRRKKRKRGQPKVIEVQQDGDEPKKDGTTPATDQPTTVAAQPAEEEEEEDLEDNPSKWVEAIQRVPPRRYAYVFGAVIGATGLVFAYQAQGEAKRAETISSALEAQRAINNARASAALANVMYGLAGAAVLLALILEFLPEPVAEKAALTYHF